MGLFDNLGGIVGGLMQGGASGGSNNDLMSMLGQALGGAGSTSGASESAANPLSGLLGQLQGSGLGDQVASWLGNGSNLPISAEQIEQALSSSQVQSLAASFGVDVSKVSGLLAQILPDAVDQASPNGTLTPPSA